MTPPPLLQVSDLTAGYGGAPVVRGVSLKVEAGEVVALLGANGAGKTTTLRVLSALLRPMSGQVSFDGADIGRVSPSRLARSGVAHVLEGRGIFFGLSVAEHFRLERLDPAAAYEYFPALEKLRDRRAGLLSGGEQQMLSLSRGLITRPKLIIADEMSLGLAPKLVDMVFDALGRLKNAGVTMIIIEQFVHRALGFADHCVLLSRGQVAWQGAPGSADREVLARYLGESADTAGD
jgi:branched-chain amino acid transport system ATP-binding protein